MTHTFTAQFIATAIKSNCDRYNAGALTYEAWSAEQYRLWDLAGRSKAITNRVRKLLTPPLVVSR